MPTWIHLPLILLFAQAPEDAEGCKDSKLLTRKAGCSIESCTRKEFDSASMLMGRTNGSENLKEVEGEIEEIYYYCSSEISRLQISRNVSGALKAAGFQLLYEGKDAFDELGITGRKGNAWITARTTSDGRYSVTTAIEQKMKQELAAEWAKDIESGGSAVIEGVVFDISSARLLPASEPVLHEVVKLLVANPEWRMRVEGHTDSTGNPALNQKLSAQRAASVAAWLIQHGIQASRLIPAGFGGSQPIDSNATESGRARNRRVMLVRI